MLQPSLKARILVCIAVLSFVYIALENVGIYTSLVDATFNGSFGQFRKNVTMALHRDVLGNTSSNKTDFYINFNNSLSSQSSDFHEDEKNSSMTDNKSKGIIAQLPIQTTIVVQLSGEMGNQLGKIAYGHMVKWMLEDEFNVTSNVILRHQNAGKWIKARNSVTSCFPKLRYKDFSEGNTQEFDERLQQQLKWLGQNRFTPLTASTMYDMASVMTNFTLIASQEPTKWRIPNNANISLPFIYANHFGNNDLLNLYFERVKDLFEYDLDNPLCCGPNAQVNEVVFHARGFETEMNKYAITMGFEEISPNKTVTELLRNLHAGDKVAVISRFRSFGQIYVNQMVEHGLDARFVETSNGEQSFCFLMSGESEIVGSAQSTFAWWASLLGNASKARIYSLKTKERIRRYGDDYFRTYNYTNPTLLRRISFEKYNSEKQDLVEKGER